MSTEPDLRVLMSAMRGTVDGTRDILGSLIKSVTGVCGGAGGRFGWAGGVDVGSGKSVARVGSWAVVLADWMDGAGDGVELAAVAHTLRHHRSRHAQFATVCAADRAQAVAGLRAVAAGQPGPGVVPARGGHPPDTPHPPGPHPQLPTTPWHRTHHWTAPSATEANDPQNALSDEEIEQLVELGWWP